MSDTLNLANSIWPNGMKVDSDGHAVFYPLGTNKVEVPTSSSEWPKGNKLVSPFVYDKDDKLVGFVDTKALTAISRKAIYLPYEHIEADFSAIIKGRLQIHAPNATTKKASWKNSGVEDIPEAQFKYKGCKTVEDVKKQNVNYNYLADISNGTWSEALLDLEQGGNYDWDEGMFYNSSALLAYESDLPSLERGYCMFAACANLTTFSADLSSLTDGKYMFYKCTALTSFTSDLSSLQNGSEMFYYCENLSEFDADLPNLTDGQYMFYGNIALTTFSTDLSSLTNGYRMFYKCTALTSFTSDLSSLTTGDNMFQYCRNLSEFDADLPNLTYGNSMFEYCKNLSEFSSDLSSLTDGSNMFENCTNLESFNSDLSSLENGYNMFMYCTNLSEFSSDLSSLQNGSGMFENCTNLESFNFDLPSLTNGYRMFFYCYNITSFSSDLSSLTNGTDMFFNCNILESFSSDLSSLQNGSEMFYRCTKLSQFDTDLPNLTNGHNMFSSCKLDAPSVKNIIDTINTYSDSGELTLGMGSLTLGMGCNDTTEDKDLFAQEVGYSDMSSLLAALQAKGWTVTALYNGRPTTTYGLRRPSTDTLPVFVQLEETEEHADYTSLDDSKKFRLYYFHETTGSTDGYTQFNSLEEAIESLNIKPIEN